MGRRWIAMMNKDGKIELKGTGEGLVIRVHVDGSLEPVKEMIQSKIDENPSFYTKATLAELTCEYLLPKAHDELKQWLFDKYQMTPPQKRRKKIPDDCSLDSSMNLEPIEWDKRLDQEKANDTKFVEGTVRSGQKIHSSGNIIVLGDVNPGAELVAKGNIVVMGSFRGIAHAGSEGNENAFVAALVLQPTQLRIHQVITRSPDDDLEKSKTPEVARLKDNAICVEPFFIKNYG